VTIIAGIVDGDSVWLGSDGRASNGMQFSSLLKSKLIGRAVGKRPLVIGVAGSMRIAQIVEFLPLPKVGRQPDAYTFMLGLAEMMRVGLRERGAGAEMNGEQWGEFEVLAAFGGRMFLIQSDYAVIEKSPHWAIGSGAAYALGALCASPESQPHARLQQALEAAARFDPYCGRPFYLNVVR
jgi:hypothetical protein